MKEKKKPGSGRVLIVILILVLSALIGAVIVLDRDPPAPAHPGGSGPSAAATAPDAVAPTEPGSLDVIDLGEGLTVSDFGPYSGIFMEDGTNDPVSDIMMLLLRNDSEQDLQYVKFSLTSGDQTLNFEGTDLPAGCCAVLLETERKPLPAAGVDSGSAQHIVFFDEPMDTCADRFEITGMDGALNIRNISGSDISGDVYVYYKYSSEDVFYGGITFRASFSGGLRDGEIRQIPTGHYTPELCRIVQVVYGE